MKIVLVSLILSIMNSPFLPTNMDDSIVNNHTSTPLETPVKFSMFPEAGVYVIPTKNGGTQRALSGGTVDSDVLLLGCMPGTVGRGGYATALCPMPEKQSKAASQKADSETAEAPQDSPEGPSFEEQLFTVLSAATPPSSELHIQPDQDWVYTQIPTLAYLTNTSGSESGSFGGVQAEVEWFASEFRIQFEPGAAPVISRVPGAPYPHHEIEYTYMSEGDFRPAATIMWGAEVTINGRSIRFERVAQTRVQNHQKIRAKDGYAVLTVNPNDRAAL
ncbi:MAG: hypothetical protein Q4P05_01185 [Actinomycetaceae bacterium]|nr:hypothetical protein [Actinomycetaceae bacterium]